MTTFQAVIYGIVHGFTEFLPVSANAHDILIAQLLGWPEPAGAFKGAMSLGAALAVFVYFIHDWASIISGFLQCILFRKKPMTLDERLPIFLAISVLPQMLAWFYLRDHLNDFPITPYVVCLLLIALTIPLAAFDYFNRKTKGMFDLNGVDSLLIGIIEIFSLFPGGGRIGSSLAGGFFKNYKREAAAKYSLLLMFPLLLASAALHLQGVSIHMPQPGLGISWLSVITGGVVVFFASLLAIGALLKQMQRGSIQGYITYRIVLALSAAGYFWFKSRY